MIIASVITLLLSKIISEIQRRKKHAANITAQMNGFVTPDDVTPQRIKEPVYEDIELTDKTSTIDLSKNVAYVCTANYSH